MQSFLPGKDPLKKYINSSNSSDRLTDIANQLPKLLLTGTVQKKIKSLKPNDLSIDLIIKKNNIREIKLAMVQLSFITTQVPRPVLP